jgi:pantothenate kinase
MSRPSQAAAPGPDPEHEDPPVVDARDMPALVDRLDRLMAAGERVILGLAGAPGVGKSTLAGRLAAAAPVPATVVPFDGFHLASQLLQDLGRQRRKGAIDTFDLAGYRSLLRRLRSADESTIYAPSYSRRLEEGIAAAIPVTPDIRLVITEGNYLLVPEAGLDAALFDEIWYVETDDALRVERLVRRHVEFGKTHAAATAWVRDSDEVNARLVAGYRSQADLVVRGGVGSGGVGSGGVGSGDAAV